MELLLGHLMGDYVFQTEWMARNKTEKGWMGHIACFSHCFFYAMCVTAFLLNFGFVEMSIARKLLLISLIFLTHYPIDKTSFAKYWIEFVLHKDIDMGEPLNVGKMFLPTVYCAVDNTMHMVLMYYIIWFFFPEITL